MLDKAIEVLEKLEENGFTAYIVGGFVRDYLIKRETTDIDICTNATPKDIVSIFNVKLLPENNYGSVVVIYKKIRFDITTYRKEIKYEDNRRPVKIKYINNLKKDLCRRDFTINTLCINSKKEVLDILNVRKDLDNKLIKTVGNPRYRIKEDSLRILRAIRFATILDFEIDKKTLVYLKKYGHLLKTLSYNRKKEELNKIFLNKNSQKGIDLLIKLNLYNHLDIPKLKDLKPCNNIIGIWSQLEVDDLYPFTKLEKEQMVKIRKLLNLDILNPYNIYKYGLYLSTIVAEIKNIDKKELNKVRNKLPILTSKDLAIKPIMISKIINKPPGSYLKEIFNDVEKQVVLGNIENNYLAIEKYIIENYSQTYP